MNFDLTHFLHFFFFFFFFFFVSKIAILSKTAFFTKIFRFLKMFLGVIISFGALVCKFGNKNVFLTLCHFLWIFFSISHLQYLQKMGIFNFSLNRFCNVFDLIKNIIKLFQTVLIQTARLKIC